MSEERLTVDDILNRKMTLFERARYAYELTQEHARQAAEREQQNLLDDTWDFLRDTLMMSDGEIGDLVMTAGPMNATRQQVLFKIGGMDFRSTYISENVGTGSKPVYELRFRLACNPKGTSSWSSVTDLASLGALLQ